MKFYHTNLIALTATALTTIAIDTEAVSQTAATDTQRATVSGPAVSHAESLSEAFRQASKVVLPTVVKIETVSRPRLRNMRSQRSENPFRGTPFEDLFRDFDGDGLRGLTPSPRPGLGSGVIIDSSGIVLTNNHVLRDADEVKITLNDGREFEGVDISTDERTDLAVVKIQGDGPFPAARLADSDALRTGDWVLAVGTPLGFEATVSAGIISGKGRELHAASRARFLQTDAAINPGNSGGPLVNLRGEVVGINTAIASQTGGFQGLGFAIPSNLARWVSNQLVSSGNVQRAYLGIGIEPVTRESAFDFGLPLSTKGVHVNHVMTGHPAEKAGVKLGDIITHFAGQPVSSTADLQRAVEISPLGSEQELRILRRGRPLTVRVRLAALPSRDELAKRTGSPSNGDSRQSFEENELGLEVENLNPQIAQRLGLGDDVRGVVVTGVQPDSIAHRQRMRPGMVIVQIGDIEVRNVEDFSRAVGEQSLDDGLWVYLQSGPDRSLKVLKKR